MKDLSGPSITGSTTAYAEILLTARKWCGLNLVQLFRRHSEYVRRLKSLRFSCHCQALLSLIEHFVNDGLESFGKCLFPAMFQFPYSKLLVKLSDLHAPSPLLMAELVLQVEAMLPDEIQQLVESIANHSDTIFD